jgi:hypothetical protein
MAKLNREWHLSNRMPERATLDQRIRWHIEHAANCACREMPAAIASEIETRGLGPTTGKSKDRPGHRSPRTR